MHDKDYYADRRKISQTNSLYSVQRMDLLIISVSGAGIYIILETLRASLAHPLGYLLLLKITGGVFMLSIITNFVSQLCGNKANDYDILWCEEKLGFDAPPTEKQIEDASTFSCKAESWGKSVGILNLISSISMMIGLLCLAIFFCITF